MSTTATIQLIVATADDLKKVKEYKQLGGGKYKTVYEPRYGQVYKLKSKETGLFDNQFYIITKDTDPLDIAVWLENKMIYIPVEGIE